MKVTKSMHDLATMIAKFPQGQAVTLMFGFENQEAAALAADILADKNAIIFQKTSIIQFSSSDVPTLEKACEMVGMLDGAHLYSVNNNAVMDRFNIIFDSLQKDAPNMVVVQDDKLKQTIENDIATVVTYKIIRNPNECLRYFFFATDEGLYLMNEFKKQVAYANLNDDDDIIKVIQTTANIMNKE